MSPITHTAPGRSAAALRDRRTAMNRALETRTPEKLAVVLYVLTRPGGDPHAHLAELLSAAARAEWSVVSREADDTGDTDPAVRPGWARAVTAVADGRAHAITAVSHVSVSPHHTLFERELDRVRSAGGGLYLLRPETHL
ncbi:hypothetical protein ACWF94_02025 [Streptomyces sp. NPDC055078]